MKTSFLWFFTGVDQAQLNANDNAYITERWKFSSLGITMAVMTILSFISSFIAFQIVSSSYLIGFLGSFVWTLIIFNLQRFLLTLSNKASQSSNVGIVELWQAMPSIIFSLIIGVTTAIPLQILIFQPDILIASKLKNIRQLSANLNKIDSVHHDNIKYLNDQLIDLNIRKNLNYEFPNEIDCVKKLQVVNLYIKESNSALELDSCLENIRTIQSRIDDEFNKIPDVTDEAILLHKLNLVLINISNEKLEKIRASKQTLGLVGQSTIAFEVVPYFSWMLVFFIMFIQIFPVLIKMLGSKSVYDYWVEEQIRLKVASIEDAAIEIGAYHFYDRNGNVVPADTFHEYGFVLKEKIREYQNEKIDVISKINSNFKSKFETIKKSLF
jgi:hypothetical protein